MDGRECVRMNWLTSQQLKRREGEREREAGLGTRYNLQGPISSASESKETSCLYNQNVDLLQ